jgi:hypothetical protein
VAHGKGSQLDLKLTQLILVFAGKQQHLPTSAVCIYQASF